jgi:iron(III) transport system permease protein
MLRDRTARCIFAVCAAFLGALFVWPVAHVLAKGCVVDGAPTARYLVGVLRDPLTREGLRNSVLIALGTTSLALALALPLAWLNHRYAFPAKGLLGVLVLAPMILPPFVGAIGFQRIFGVYGVLNALFNLGPVDWLGRGRFLGVVVLQALALYPILYLTLLAALGKVDPALEEAARNLGASGRRVFARVTVPLMLPGLFAGASLVFIWSFTELGAPLMLNVSRCASVQIFDALKEIGDSPRPYALVTVVLVCSVALYTVAHRAFGGRDLHMPDRAAVAEPRRVAGRRGLLVALPFAAVAGAALLPHAGVALTSLAPAGAWYRSVMPDRLTTAHYVEALGHDLALSGIRNSLFFSSLAVALNIVAGLLIALVLVRSRLRGRGLLDMLAMAPLAVPGLVTAFGYLSLSAALSNWPPLADAAVWQNLVDVRTNPTVFLVIAYAVRRLPYMVRAAAAGLQQTSVTLEEAAANLGAPPAVVARRVTVPLIAAGLFAGALLAFTFSMLEVSDSLMLAQQAEYFPVTKAIYELFQRIGTGRFTAAALGVWAMAFLAVALSGVRLLLGRRMGALFRI